MEDFPYKRTFLTEKMIKKRFKNLVTYKAKYILKDYKIRNIPSLTYYERCYLPKERPVILLNSPDWHEYEEISDYFIEPIRLRATRNDAEPIEEYWQKNKERLLLMDNLYQMRETISQEYKEVGSFRPTNLCAMIDLFHPKSIIDFCGGWGDRLLACLAKKIPCVLVDPNTPLHQYYKEMIEMFCNNPEPCQILNSTNHNDNSSHNIYDMGKYVTIDSPFQEAILPDRVYDLAFTSPPYFTLEKYSNDPRQSDKLGDWYNDFLLFSIKKVWELLAQNGHMVLVINNNMPKPRSKREGNKSGGSKDRVEDRRDNSRSDDRSNDNNDRRNNDQEDFMAQDYVKRMIADINLFIDSIYLGVISYSDVLPDGNFKSPQPMWIWKKVMPVAKDPLCDKIPDLSLVYAGDFNTYDRVARIAKYKGKPLTIFCPKKRISFVALSLGAKFIESDNIKKDAKACVGYTIPYNLKFPR